MEDRFKGFSDSESFTRIPDAFFRELLADMQDAGELKVSLYALWRFEHMESRLHVLREADFNEVLPEAASALEKAVQRGTLLRVKQEAGNFYFLNSPRGRAAAQAYVKNPQAGLGSSMASQPPLEQPNIFKLYEENIGLLTPLMAEALKDAEINYPPEWLAEALEIAVKSNKRSWKYVEAILRRWKEEGHAKKQDRRDAEEPRGHDVARKVEDFLKR